MGGGREHWDAIYRDRDPHSLSWHRDQPVSSLQWLPLAGIGAGEPVIDVGAGVSTFIDVLLARGYRDLTAVDISVQALRRARGRLGSGAGRVSWFVGDVTRLAVASRFALWHDRAVLHFLIDAADARAYAGAMARALVPGGYAVIGTFAVDGPPRCSGLEVMPYDASRIRALVGV